MAKDIKKFAHPDYLDRYPDYIKIRDCYNGERAVKSATTAYLPRLTGQLQQDYDNYLFRALFFPITGKTVTSMVGLAVAKPPKTTYPDLLESYFVDSEVSYQFTEFYVSTMSEVILMGRYGVLIDAPLSGSTNPTLVPYTAENIINWSHDEHGKLVMLLLREVVRITGDDKFEIKNEVRFRHCYLIDGVYTVETLDEDLALVGPAVQPSFSGSTIDYIPWTPFGSSGCHMQVDKPPMLDISTINISHYLTSADLEWGRHLVGLPTPVVTGVDSSTTLKVGGTTAWVLPPAESKAFYMEFIGQGLGSLERAMTEKVSLMASISARLIDNSTRGSEAAETVRLRYMNESASLIHIITAVESGFNMLYNSLSKLMKAGGTVEMKFSREILGAGITFKDLSVLFEAYLQGSLSKESLLYNLRRLEAVDPNRTDEQELSDMRDPPPVSQPVTKPAASPTQ